MTEDEWLDACADKPEDDPLCCAFADWLDEQGMGDVCPFFNRVTTQIESVALRSAQNGLDRDDSEITLFAGSRIGVTMGTGAFLEHPAGRM